MEKGLLRGGFNCGTIWRGAWSKLGLIIRVFPLHSLLYFVWQKESFFLSFSPSLLL